MTARGGRNNGIYAWVPLRLASDCPKCGAERGYRCVKRSGEQRLPMVGTHVERRKKRRGV